MSNTIDTNDSVNNSAFDTNDAVNLSSTIPNFKHVDLREEIKIPTQETANCDECDCRDGC
jgi:hypothetical protein